MTHRQAPNTGAAKRRSLRFKVAEDKRIAKAARKTKVTFTEYVRAAALAQTERDLSETAA